MNKWEAIENDDNMLLSDRLKVHNGWIVRSRYTMDVNGYSVGSLHQIFILAISKYLLDKQLQ